MYTKKLLLTLPLVAILAGCNKAPAVADIFKAARKIPAEIRTYVLNNYHGWQMDSERESSCTLRITEGDIVYREMIGTVDAFMAMDASSNYYYAYCSTFSYWWVDYDEEYDRFEGDYDESIKDPSKLFYGLYDASFIWSGRVDVGLFDYCYLKADTKMNSEVSKRARVVNGTFASGTVRAYLQNGVSYRAGKFNYKIKEFDIVYKNYLLDTYHISYEYSSKTNRGDLKIEIEYTAYLEHTY